jgi:hypothetical protein
MRPPVSPPRGSDIPQAIEEAVACFRQGRLDQAEKICTRLLKIEPRLFDALHILGLVKLYGGKPAAALGYLEAALKVDPASAQAMSNLAMVLAALNRDAEALAMLDRALALDPRQAEAINNRGNVLLKLNRPQEALAAFEQVLALMPRMPSAAANRGNALAQLGRHEEAMAQFDAVIANSPPHAETFFNRGTARSAGGHHVEAIDDFDRALALRPDYPKAWLNRGKARHALNRHSEAIADFDAVIARDKGNADAHHNKALALLTLGDYRRGFEDYEWRWDRSGMPPRRKFGKPLWLGDYPLARRTILVHAEQGLGDTIQFARYAPLLARTGAKVVIEAQPELTGLLGRIEGVSAVVARGTALPEFDVHCPAGSLPRALRTEVATIPADVPYLRASEERIAKWRPQLDALASPRIAIAWSGSAGHANDRNRSIALDRLAPLLANERASFVSIQKELRAGDAEALARTGGVVHLGEALADFDDTAAVVTLADLVVAVDTSVVHLAGALGRPTLVLVPFCPDWRWMVEAHPPGGARRLVRRAGAGGGGRGGGVAGRRRSRRRRGVRLAARGASSTRAATHRLHIAEFANYSVA